MNSFNGNSGSFSISGQNFFNCPVYMGYPMYALPLPAPGGFGPGGFGPGAAPGGFGPGAAPGGFGPGGFWPGGAGAVAVPLPGGAQDQPVAAAPAVVQPGPVHPALEAPAPIGDEIVVVRDEENPLDEMRRLAREARDDANRSWLYSRDAEDAVRRAEHHHDRAMVYGVAAMRHKKKAQEAEQHAQMARVDAAVYAHAAHESALDASLDANAAQRHVNHASGFALFADQYATQAHNIEMAVIGHAFGVVDAAVAASHNADAAGHCVQAATGSAIQAIQAAGHAFTHELQALQNANAAAGSAAAAQGSANVVQAGLRAAGDIMGSARSIRQDALSAANRAEAAAQRANPPFIIVMDVEGSSDDDEAAPVAAPVAVPPAAQPGGAPLYGGYNLRPRNVRPRIN